MPRGPNPRTLSNLPPPATTTRHCGHNLTKLVTNSFGRNSLTSTPRLLPLSRSDEPRRGSRRTGKSCLADLFFLSYDHGRTVWYRWSGIIQEGTMIFVLPSPPFSFFFFFRGRSHGSTEPKEGEKVASSLKAPPPPFPSPPLTPGQLAVKILQLPPPLFFRRISENDAPTPPSFSLMSLCITTLRVHPRHPPLNSTSPPFKKKRRRKKRKVSVPPILPSLSSKVRDHLTPSLPPSL